MNRPIDEQDVVNALTLLVNEVGNQRVVAERLGISRQYLNDILQGRRPPAARVLEAMGLHKQVTFTPIGKDMENVLSITEWQAQILQRMTAEPTAVGELRQQASSKGKGYSATPPLGW